MGNPLAVLLVEDEARDSLLLLRELRRGGYEPTFERVETAEAMTAALDRRPWDLIISDYGLPHFSAVKALALMKQQGHELPFIIVSGTISEEIAVAAMHAGAHDFMVKGKLARLLPAIERELHEAAGRVERKKLQEQLLVSDRTAAAFDTRERTVAEREELALLREEALAAREAANVANAARDRLVLQMREANQTLVLTLGELHDRQEELARVNRSLEERVEFEQQMLGIVSHDLRTPLGVIIMSASVLLGRGDLDEKQATNVGRIASSGRRAERMIRDLLDFTQARIGGGIPVKRSALLDLHALARQVVDEIRAAHPESEIRLEHFGDGLGQWDSDRIAQVLTNLVSNAIQYGSKGTPVRVESRGMSNALALSVHNQGPAIPQETRAVLFQPMRRGNEHARRGREGLGLGLFIVKQIVVAHAGVVDVQSSEAEGTTFTVTLPR